MASWPRHQGHLWHKLFPTYPEELHRTGKQFSIFIDGIPTCCLRTGWLQIIAHHAAATSTRTWTHTQDPTWSDSLQLIFTKAPGPCHAFGVVSCCNSKGLWAQWLSNDFGSHYLGNSTAVLDHFVTKTHFQAQTSKHFNLHALCNLYSR